MVVTLVVVVVVVVITMDMVVITVLMVIVMVLLITVIPWVPCPEHLLCSVHSSVDGITLNPHTHPVKCILLPHCPHFTHKLKQGSETALATTSRLW